MKPPVGLRRIPTSSGNHNCASRPCENRALFVCVQHIANNFALFAAGFVEIAMYFSDVWPQWRGAVRAFIYETLPKARDEMVGKAHDQQASQIFWSELANLVENDQVDLSDRSAGQTHKTTIGRRHVPRSGVSHDEDLFMICTSLAMQEINKSLRAQGRPELRVTASTLLGHLQLEGKLFDQDGQPLSKNADATIQRRVGGQNRRGFIISRRMLLAEDPFSNSPTETVVVESSDS